MDTPLDWSQVPGGRPRLLIWLLVVTTLALALFAITLLVAFDAGAHPILNVLLGLSFTTANLVTIGAIFMRPTRTAFSLAKGYAAWGILTWPSLLGFLAIGGGLNSEGALLVFSILIANELVHIWLFVVARRTEIAAFGDSRASIARGFGLVAVITGIAVGVAETQVYRIRNAVEGRDFRKQVESDSIMRHAVVRVEACALRHTRAQPQGGFPRSLAEMGPSGDACLEAGLAAGTAGNVALRYTPAPQDASGDTPAYTVTARRDKVGGLPWYSVFGDTSGFVREGGLPEQPAADTTPPADYSMRAMGLLRTCLLLSGAARGGRFPATLEEMIGTAFKLPRTSLWPGCEYRGVQGFLQPGSRYAPERGAPRYRPERGPDGTITNFTLEMRPSVYGETGIRSYAIHRDGGLRVTLENRAATERDPEVPACRYGEDDGRCVPLISTVAPVVSLIHERVVARDRPIGLRVRDPQDTTRAPDPTYQFVYFCGTTNTPPAPSVAWVFRPDPEFQCREPAAWLPQPKSGDSAGVQVWVRDVTGAIGLQQGFVHVQD